VSFQKVEISFVENLEKIQFSVVGTNSPSPHTGNPCARVFY
jgi:hypothetical protein